MASRVDRNSAGSKRSRGTCSSLLTIPSGVRTARTIDTGTPGSGSAIEDGLKAAGTGFAAVKHVILTHYHDDHIGGLSDIEPKVKGTFYASTGDAGNIITDKPLKTLKDDSDEVSRLATAGRSWVERNHGLAGHVARLSEEYQQES